MAKFTVTEALVKLKLLDKRINDARDQTLTGYVTSKGNRQIPAGFANVEEFKKEIARRLESAQGLIKYRDSLKRVVVDSNARTPVKIGEAQMTVAQAIETKTGIAYKKALHKKLREELTKLDNLATQQNASLDAKADQFLVQMFGSNNSTTPQSEKDSARNNWLEANRVHVETHDIVRKTSEELGREIEDFEANVDVQLSVVNGQTYVEVAD